MMDEELPARAKKVGAYLGGLLGKLADIPCVGDIRGVGLIWGVELIEESGAPISTAATSKVLAYAKEQGVIFGKNAGIAAGPSNTVTISPPLVFTEEEAERAASVLDGALRRVQAESGDMRR